jgi:hypothetical protein
LPCVFVGLRQPAKVKNPFAPGAHDGGRKRARKLPVAARRIRVPSQHRVRQVIRRFAAAQVFDKSVCISQVADDDFDPRLRGPASGLQLLWTASQTPYPIASLQKTRHQTATDIAGGACHEYISIAVGPIHGESAPCPVILSSRLEYFTVAEQRVLLNDGESTRGSQRATLHFFSFTSEKSL